MVYYMEQLYLESRVSFYRVNDELLVLESDIQSTK